MSTPELPVLAVTQDEAIKIIRSQKVFRRALHHGWIKPVIQGGRGRTSISDLEDILELWKRLKKELPPKLPCETKGVMGFLGSIWELLIGEEKEEPVCSPADLDKMVAIKHAEAEKKRDAEKLVAEKANLNAKITEDNQRNQGGRRSEFIGLKILDASLIK